MSFVKSAFWRSVKETDYTQGALLYYGSYRSPHSHRPSSYSEAAIRAEDFLFAHMKNQKANPLVKPFIEKPPKSVLDLMGTGINTLSMAEKGTKVAVIHNISRILDSFPAKDRLPNIELFSADLTKVECFGEGVDLVIAVEALSLIPPSALRSTLQKIHYCLCKEGVFIGTILTAGYSLDAQEGLKQIGFAFYGGGQFFVRQLLQYSGFKVEELVEIFPGDFSFKASKQVLEDSPY